MTDNNYPVVKVELDGGDFSRWIKGLSAIINAVTFDFVNLGRAVFPREEEALEYADLLEKNKGVDIMRLTDKSNSDQLKFSGITVCSIDLNTSSLTLGCYPREKFKDCIWYTCADRTGRRNGTTSHFRVPVDTSSVRCTRRIDRAFEAAGGGNFSLKVALKKEAKGYEQGLLNKLADITPPSSTLVMDYVEGVSPHILFTSHVSATKKFTRKMQLLEADDPLGAPPPAFWAVSTFRVSVLKADIKNATASCETGDVTFTLRRLESVDGLYAGVLSISSHSHSSDSTEYLLPKSREESKSNSYGKSTSFGARLVPDEPGTGHIEEELVCSLEEEELFDSFFSDAPHEESLQQKRQKNQRQTKRAKRKRTDSSTLEDSDGLVSFSFLSSEAPIEENSEKNAEKVVILHGATLNTVMSNSTSSMVSIHWPVDTETPMYFHFPLEGGASFGYVFAPKISPDE